MKQQSIIDSIKKVVVCKKAFKVKDDETFSFDTIAKVTDVLFSRKINSDMLHQYFQYKYMDKTKGKTRVQYYVESYSSIQKKIIIIRKADEGVYTTTLELINNKKFYYFETVNLKEPPFWVWGHINVGYFKRMFRRRVKLIKGELYGK